MKLERYHELILESDDRGIFLGSGGLRASRCLFWALLWGPRGAQGSPDLGGPHVFLVAEFLGPKQDNLSVLVDFCI